MKLEFKKWLLVGAHPDDVETGCGGIITKFIDDIKIKYVIFSTCLEDPRNKNILTELRECSSVLGISQEDTLIMDLPRRKFHDFRTEIRQHLITIKDDFQPDLICCPSIRDIHQDHAITAEETLRLFRDNSVLYYEVIRSSIQFQPNMYISLSKTQLDRKIEALMKYKSQFDRFYFKPDVVSSLARMRGSQAHLDYAEAFEIARMVPLL